MVWGVACPPMTGTSQNAFKVQIEHSFDKTPPFDFDPIEAFNPMHSIILQIVVQKLVQTGTCASTNVLENFDWILHRNCA